MITKKVWTAVFDKLPLCTDSFLGPSLSLKNLEYGLRIASANDKLYKSIADDRREEYTQKFVIDKTICLSY